MRTPCCLPMTEPDSPDFPTFTPMSCSLTLLHKSSLAVCLRGFNPHDHELASRLLGSRGHRIVRTLGAAQFVVAGPEVEGSLLESTRARGLEVATWDAVREELATSTFVDDGSVTGPAVPMAREAVLPLLEREGGRLRVLDVWLETLADSDELDRRHIPEAVRFAGLCFDQPFVETLHAVLAGTTRRLPVALEGETAASKTTAVLYLAHLLGQPVVRLNLNGQTDAGELVGRFIPSADGWMFQEGALPAAMRRGHWLLLDEMNLAEPQVLERLNCALESPPTLVLSEGHGTVFGPGGDVEVADRFRLLATLNPAEYSGRSVLSPAFRNRWILWHQARGPGETEALAMLRVLVFGEQPIVHWNGQAYQAAASEPAYPRIAKLADADTLLPRLALFHSTVAKAAAPGPGASPGLGRHRRERMSFTRRNLLAALDWIEADLASPHAHPRDAVAAAIRHLYAGCCADPADAKAVHSHARAAGLL